MPPARTDDRLLAKRYRLLEPLGRGGMGTVWRARDELLGRPVAIKEVLLPPELTAEERAVFCRRTIREARAAGRLSHPNVVVVYDVVEERGRPWIVMQYLPSRSLGQLIREEGPLPPRRVAEIGLQVLAALRAAHAAGVLHRDVKPENVLLAEDGRVVLTDFGIATLEEETSLTVSGVLLGTPSYIAPERAAGGPACRESDLWSLGATLYTAVEGRPPYDRGAAIPTMAAVINEDPDPLRLAGPLAPAIEGLLRRDPGSRIGAERAALLLRLALHDNGTQQYDEREPEPQTEPSAIGAPATVPQSPVGTTELRRGRKRRNVLALLAVAGAVILVVGGVTAWDALRPERPASQRPGAAVTTSTVGATTTAPSTERPPQQRERQRSTPARLPAGFYRYTDPTGFSVALPKGWRVTKREREGQPTGPAVYFQPPGGGRLLIVDHTSNPKSDPYADWVRQEQARKDSMPGYRRVFIRRVNYAEAAADWEFTYVGRSGRVHVRNRGFVASDDHGYAIYWSTADSRWEEDFHYFEVFAATFRPAP